jgi:AcrR family transcriptional regulator
MDKKEKLLKTAIKLFVKQGFENTPTSQISKEAGVASGTLFYHFKTKEELINSAYIYCNKSVSAVVNKDFDKTEDTKEKIRKLWFNMINWGLNNKIENDFIQKFLNSKYISKLNIKEMESLFEEIKETMKSGIKQGIIKDWSFEIISSIFMSIYHIFLNDFIKKKKVDNQQILNSFEVLWDSINKNKTR